MKFIKVKNLRQQTGACDYKGLDIDLIVTGSQLYPSDDNSAYFMYNGEVVNHIDLSIITQDEYEKVKNIEIDTEKPTLESEVNMLKEQNAQMLLALVNGGLI